MLLSKYWDAILTYFISPDSVYTERYMLTPQLNADGYAKSAVSNMTGFNNTQYLLVHGTGDDNGKKNAYF
jgi:dipeptidyl aminopeptidase/acylaminoacyl peptidase